MSEGGFDNTSLKLPTINLDPRILHSNRAKRFTQDTGISLSNNLNKTGLISRGWVFLNAIGGGEKAIIQQVGDQDYSNKLFLTKKELEFAKSHMTPKDLTDDDLVSISDDMMKFIEECQEITQLNQLCDTNSREGKRHKNFIMILRQDLNLDTQTPIPTRLHLDEITQATCETIKKKYLIPDNVRGISIKNIERRSEGQGVQGSPSPLLTDEYIFQGGDGIIIHQTTTNENVTKEVSLRLNPVVARLARFGICNTGEPNDPTQRYFSISDYQPIYEKRGAQSTTDIPNSKELLMEIRLNIAEQMIAEWGLQINREQLKEMGQRFLWW